MRIKSGKIVSLFVAFFLYVLCISTQVRADEVVALKNNLLYDAAATPNLEVEVKLARRWSLEVGAGFNPFPLDDKQFPKWRHVAAWVAPRYWFCNVYHRDFISVNAAYAHFNVAGDAYPVAWMYPQIKDARYQGDAVMGGVSYGWHFAISPHFSIELEGGLDAGYAWYDQFECKHCGNKTSQGGRWLVLPKVGVSISVPLGGDEISHARRCRCETHEYIDPLPGKIDTLRVDSAMPEPYVPYFEPKVDRMHHLRNRLLREAADYEPYRKDMALSADPRNVFLYFDVNVTKMDRQFIQNDMLMDSIMQILGDALADSTVRIAHIQIVGFASFDGKLAYNERLAAARARTIKEYVQSVYEELPDNVFAVCNGGESWAELEYQLKANRDRIEFEGLDDVLAAIKEVRDPDKREARIKRLRRGETYRFMRDELQFILRNLGCITIFIESDF